MKKCVSSILFLFLLSSCAGPAKVLISSNPGGADVYLVGNQGEQTSLGKTPLDLSESGFFGTNDAVKIRIEHSSYKEKELFISRPPRLGQIDLSVKLEESPRIEDIGVKKLNSLAGQIAEGQAFIHKRDYNSAKQIFELLANEFPQVAAIHDLLGNSYYLLGNKKMALKAYTLASGLEPGNYKRQVVINKLSEVQQ